MYSSLKLGVVMVKCPDHMNEPYWPARIISLSEYDEIYAESRFVDLPGKKVRLVAASSV
jgi:hypothetical protein